MPENIQDIHGVIFHAEKEGDLDIINDRNYAIIPFFINHSELPLNM